ncbi:MAG: hypothetical protein HYR64_08965 [Fimbriimonas ginsengisoli]|uniref:Methylamine utilisation protein MauE domain-containing protein n=1 Tax=Fimbriimonas ginsengisoli TaxID=1005039 RepID=A0A931LWQ9_FIMGI|nr:hypothetical protein [Fimbriimonas ginsengisoli]
MTLPVNLLAPTAGLILIASGVAKAFDFGEAATMIQITLVAFPPWSQVVAVATIALELVAGFSLALRPAAPLGRVVGTALASGFAGFNLVHIARHIQVPCKCFGALFTASPGVMLAIDGLLVALIWAGQPKAPPPAG